MRRFKRRLKRRLHNKFILIPSIIVLLLSITSSTYIFYTKQEESNQQILLQTELRDLKKYLVMEDFNQEKITNYNKKLQEDNKYSVVEQALLEYSKDISTTFSSYQKIVNNTNLLNILSSTNYKNDGPLFTNSVNLIDKTTKDITQTEESLTKLSNDKTRLNYIKEKTNDEKLIKTYDNLSKKLINNDLLTSKNNILDSIQHIISTSHETLVFLYQTNNTWHIENDNIVFTSQDNLNKYNNFINKLLNNK